MDEVLKFFLEYKDLIFIIVLSVFLGIEVISHVPAVLHTPLMSGSNAIHGVVIIGAIIVMGHAESTLSLILGFIAVILGTLNVVGGFVVTDRMLEMFKKKKKYGERIWKQLQNLSNFPAKSPFLRFLTSSPLFCLSWG